MLEYYSQGFVDKCAEAGIDSDQLVKSGAGAAQINRLLSSMFPKYLESVGAKVTRKPVIRPGNRAAASASGVPWGPAAHADAAGDVGIHYGRGSDLSQVMAAPTMAGRDMAERAPLWRRLLAGNWTNKLFKWRPGSLHNKEYRLKPNAPGMIAAHEYTHPYLFPRLDQAKLKSESAKRGIGMADQLLGSMFGASDKVKGLIKDVAEPSAIPNFKSVFTGSNLSDKGRQTASGYSKGMAAHTGIDAEEMAADDAAAGFHKWMAANHPDKWSRINDLMKRQLGKARGTDHGDDYYNLGGSTADRLDIFKDLAKSPTYSKHLKEPTWQDARRVVADRHITTPRSQPSESHGAYANPFNLGGGRPLAKRILRDGAIVGGTAAGAGAAAALTSK